MRSRFTVRGLILLLAGFLVIAVGTGLARNSCHKPVTICHKPGTPAEMTIVVDKSAVPGHLAHGDYLGECREEPPPPPPEPPPPLPPPEPPPPVPPPDPPPSVSSVGFCVQTSDYGWTFVQAYRGAFEYRSGVPAADQDEWWKLWMAKAKVEVTPGKTVMLAGPEPWEPGQGIVFAPNVPGVGLTCDQPYVPDLIR